MILGSTLRNTLQLMNLFTKEWWPVSLLNGCSNNVEIGLFYWAEHNELKPVWWLIWKQAEAWFVWSTYEPTSTASQPLSMEALTASSTSCVFLVIAGHLLSGSLPSRLIPATKPTNSRIIRASCGRSFATECSLGLALHPVESSSKQDSEAVE